MAMTSRLFSEWTREDRSPRAMRESIFDYVDRMAGPLWANVRKHLNDWVYRYPAEHRPELLGRLRSRSDSVDFYAAYWELFLYHLLVRSGYEVVCHPDVPGTSKKPDFRASRDGAAVYVEAKLVGDSAAERRRQRERVEVWAELDRRVSSEHFFVRLGIIERGHSPLPHRLLAQQAEAWLGRLDVDAVRVAVADGGLRDVDAFEWRHEKSGWAISLAPIPKTQHHESHRLVGMGEAEGWFPNDRAAFRGALADEGHRYGRSLDAPLIVALSMGRAFVDDFDVINALFGDEVVEVHRETMATTMARARNGVWLGPRGPRARGLSGVLVGKSIGPWSLASARLTHWANPWASSPSAISVSCVGTVSAGDDVLDRREAAQSILEWMGLPQGWPEPDDPTAST